MRQIGENDQFGELLNRSMKENLSHSGDDTIDKLIKAAMPIEKGGGNARARAAEEDEEQRQDR